MSDMAQNMEKRKTPFQANLKKFFTNKLAILGLVVLVLLLLFAIFGPFFTGYDYETIDMLNMLAKPNSDHLLGTDELGRDILTRLAWGGRVSISVGIIATVVELIIGVLLGSIAGLYGGVVESVIMRITDIIMCFPFFVIALSIAAITGPSYRNVILIIGILGWPAVCRIVRSKVLYLKNMEYVEAARALGLSQMEIIFRHILPNAMGPIIVFTTLSVAKAVLLEASLSFLGVGIAKPQSSWGTMLSEAQNMQILQDCWWMWVPAGLLVLLTVLSINFLGDGLAEVLDPKSRGKGEL